MNLSTTEKRAWGISMGSMHWSAHAIAFDHNQRSIQKGSNEENIPASVLIGRMVGEPLRFDYWSPPHPRGTAEPWPPEAAVSRDIGSGRCPIAAAWTGRVDDANRIWCWRFDEQTHELSSLDAIASGASHLTRLHAKDAPSAIVIPNDFRQREQQKLLDACAIVGLNTSLLWLPVAAALAWLDLQVGLLPPKTLSDAPLTLPVVHADWGQIRCSTLQLVPTETETGFRWIPARKRPVVSDWHTPSFGWTEAAACDDSNSQAMWKQRFATPVRTHETNCSMSKSNLLEQIADWSVEQKSSWQVDLSLAEHLSKIPSPVAVVFVGDFANRVASGEQVNRRTRIWEHSQPTQGRFPYKFDKTNIRTLVADGLAGERLLAQGAAIFARDRHDERISYLDTLPVLELFIDRTHNYDWFKLLGDLDRYVPGGKVWSSYPIDGLALRRGSTSIKLVLAHEEFDGVREMTAAFDQASELDLPVQLRVSATPAQGNAVLELVSEEQENQKSRRVLANWNRMALILDDANDPMDKQRYMETRPRAFPNVRPRHANPQRWRTFEKHSLHLIKRNTNEATLGKYHISVGRLLDASRIAGGAAALSSDGNVPDGERQETAREIANLLVTFIVRWGDSSRVTSDVMKILGFVCAPDADLASWIKKTLATHPQMDEPFCILCGSCIRHPKTAKAFVNRLLDEIITRKRNRLLSYQMQSLGKLLSYRHDILSLMSEQRMYDLFRECLKVFKDQNQRDNLAWLFEHSGLVIVYALRYRLYDHSFLPPESELALEAKGEFEIALRKLAKFLQPKSRIAERLRNMYSIRIGTRRYRSQGRGYSGKNISLSRADYLASALVQLTDYIDRRGEGDVLIAVEE